MFKETSVTPGVRVISTDLYHRDWKAPKEILSNINFNVGFTNMGAILTAVTAVSASFKEAEETCCR